MKDFEKRQQWLKSSCFKGFVSSLLWLDSCKSQRDLFSRVEVKMSVAQACKEDELNEMLQRMRKEVISLSKLELQCQEQSLRLPSVSHEYGHSKQRSK